MRLGGRLIFTALIKDMNRSPTRRRDAGRCPRPFHFGYRWRRAGRVEFGDKARLGLDTTTVHAGQRDDKTGSYKMEDFGVHPSGRCAVLAGIIQRLGLTLCDLCLPMIGNLVFFVNLRIVCKSANYAYQW